MVGTLVIIGLVCGGLLGVILVAYIAAIFYVTLKLGDPGERG